MIRRLRTRHRRFWTIAALALPILFLITLLLRPDRALEERLPAALQVDATGPMNGGSR